MPAKKARRISKQNKEIIRRNYNKKMIQLNRLIYELSWYSSEVNLQREFIQDFFNEQIDRSISIYRNQVKKLQDSSVDDYNFIVERTERFYQRKYQKLIEMTNNDYSKMLEDILLFEKNSINSECNDLKQLINDLNQQISQEQEKFEAETQEWQQNISEKIKEIELKGQKIIDDNLIELEKKYNQYQINSDEKFKMLQKCHKEELEKIRNEITPIDFNIVSTYHYDKIDFDKYKEDVKIIQDQYKIKLSEIKNQIFDEINNIKKEEDFHQDKYKELEELFANQINEMDKLINNLISNFNAMKDQNNLDILSLKSELEELQSKNKEILAEKSNFFSKNSQNDESSIDYLIKSLKSKFELFQQKINNEMLNKNAKIDSILQELDKCSSDLLDQISQLTEELNSQKIQHSQEVESYRSDFISEKEKITNLYRDKIAKITSNILLLKNNKEQARFDYQLVLDNLQNEKDFLISSNNNELNEIDQNTEKTINQLIKDHDLNRKSLQSQINEMINKDKHDNSNKISEIKKQNQEKIEIFKKQKEKEYQEAIDLIKKDSYSKSEYDKIVKSYQDEFETLQNILNESSVLAPESELYKNMARVISDLESELKDHEVIIQSRGRCLRFEWQEKVRKENERFERSPFNEKFLANPRARDQMKKSLQSKINDVIKGKNEALSILSTSFNQNSIVDFNDEIKNLQNVLDQLNKQKNALVQEAILKKDEMIKNKKEQIDQIQYEFGRNKRDLLNKINDQKIDFNSNYKKLNESLLSTRKDYNQAEQKENNSFQSKLNMLSFQFCESKGQLLGEINDLNGRIPSGSLSSSISSSSSASSLISQETKDAWTKQRKDFDAKVQCLRDQISSELSKLNCQKEEISRNLDNIWKDKLDKKMKLMKIMANWSPKSSDADLIAKLESNLKAVTIQLTNAINEMKKYKNLIMEQEIQINKKFGGMSEVGLLQ